MPPDRAEHVAAFDAARGQVVVFGGRLSSYPSCRGNDGTCKDVWRYGPGRARPHLVAALDLRAAGLVDPAREVPLLRPLESVEVRARVGALGHTAGTGQADGEPVAGFSTALLLPGRGGWVPLSPPGAAGAGAPEDWSARIDPGWGCGEPWCAGVDLSQTIGADGRLRVAWSALAPQGASADVARISLDYLELQVWYRQPEEP